MNRDAFLPVPFIFCVDTVWNFSVIFKYEVDKSEKLPEFEYLLSSFAVWMINPTSWRYKAIQMMHFLWGELWQFVFFRELFYFMGTARCVQDDRHDPYITSLMPAVFVESPAL